MEIFKIFFCNWVYHHRHSGKWGHSDMPIFFTFMLLWYSVGCINTGTLYIVEFVFGIKITFVKELYWIVPTFITLFLYWRMVCGKRYISILKNPKYYSKKKRIMFYCFVGVSLVYFGFSLYLMHIH